MLKFSCRAFLRRFGLAILAATTLLAVGTAQAKSPGPNGRIAFVRILNAVAVETPQRATYTVNPDGTHPELLPIGTAPDPAPVWSPDGSEILASSSQCPTSGSGECQVIVNVETGALRELPIPDEAFSTCLPGSDCGNAFWSCRAWSPNGARLACHGSSEVDPSRNGIYTVRSSDGLGLTLVTHKFGALGEFSPDGSRLVFEGYEGEGVALYVVRLDGSRLRQITPSGMLLNPDLTDGGSWSPFSNKIVTWAQSDEDHRFSIWMVKADGSALHEVAIAGCGGLRSEAHTIGCRRPIWSPDGTKLVFERRNPATGQFDIYTVNADGTGLSAVAHTGLDEGLPDWGPHPLSP